MAATLLCEGTVDSYLVCMFLEIISNTGLPCYNVNVAKVAITSLYACL